MTERNLKQPQRKENLNHPQFLASRIEQPYVIGMYKHSSYQHIIAEVLVLKFQMF
jgi:hypothetical protein